MEGLALTDACATDAPLTIGALAKRTGVPAKTIRYYEEVGLLPKPRRAANGYRSYDERAVHTLRFVGRSRDLGFSMEDIGELLTLWNNKGRKSSSVRAIAEAHVAAIQDKIHLLEDMKNTLEHLVHCCRGDDRPDCPILHELSAQE